MKRIIMAVAATIAISTSVMAQPDAARRRTPDKAEMAKHRTERMVKEYNLNDEQASRLLELNTKFADKMGPGPRMHKRRPEMAPDATPQTPDATTGATERAQPVKKLDERRPPEMEEYDKELKEILTPEQYTQYQDNMKKRREFRNRPEGPRPPRRQ